MSSLERFDEKILLHWKKLLLTTHDAGVVVVSLEVVGLAPDWVQLYEKHNMLIKRGKMSWKSATLYIDRQEQSVNKCKDGLPLELKRMLVFLSWNECCKNSFWCIFYSEGTKEPIRSGEDVYPINYIKLESALGWLLLTQLIHNHSGEPLWHSGRVMENKRKCTKSSRVRYIK
jgi:hypothetical protein